MSAPYLEEIREQLQSGVRTIAEIADNIAQRECDDRFDVESCALSINNGICKGYWSLVEGDRNFDGSPRTAR